MSKADQDALVRLDLNNPVFQENLLSLQKPERHAALDTLNRLRRMTWNQVYRDSGLKWEKIVSVKPPAGAGAIYSLRITQARRATAFRDGAGAAGGYSSLTSAATMPMAPAIKAPSFMVRRCSS